MGDMREKGYCGVSFQVIQLTCTPRYYVTFMTVWPQSKVVMDLVVSTGQRNDLVEFLQWCHIAKGGVGPGVETSLDAPQVSHRLDGEVGLLWQVLAK